MSASGWKTATFAVSILVCAAIVAVGASSHKLSVHAGKAELIVTVPDGQFTLTDQEITRYVQRGAEAIVRYFGKFPMPRIDLDLQPARGNDVVFGRTKPIHGATITMFVGRECASAALDDDWTLTHEMTHVAFPATKEDDTDWLGEGMATYVEPVARAQAGYLTPEYVWNEFVMRMPRGEPQPGEGGLNQAHAFRRIYWGGAMFFLVADIETRRANGNKKGMQDAFRYIMNDKGTIAYQWPIAMILKEGDDATDTHVLEDMYTEWKDKPVEVDLPKIWKSLGIEKSGTSVVFHDDAPDAPIRRAIIAVKP
jgi:hypothetical protein